MWGLAAIGMRLALLLFVGEGVVVGGTWLVNAGQYNDPFAPYEALMPGQPVIETAQYPCQLRYTPGTSGRVTTCEIYPGEGPFVSVVAVVYDGTFRQIWFDTDGLYAGDVILHLGQPHLVAEDHQRWLLSWDTGLQAVLDPGNSTETFHYKLPIEQVTITI